jgi:hypothetical protein
VACDAGGLSFELSEGTGWISRTCEEQIPALQPLKKLDQALDLALEAAVELLVGLQEVTRSPHDHLDLQLFKLRDGPSLYEEI